MQHSSPSTRSNPLEPSQYRVLFHHVVALDLQMPSAIGDAAARLFSLPGFAGSGVSMSDWAFLADLAVDAPNVTAQMEFGVLAEQELPMRLQRYVGRVAHGLERPSTPDFDNANFPKSALFAESSWSTPHPGGEPLVQTALEFWERSRERADEVVGALHTTITGNQQKKGHTA